MDRSISGQFNPIFDDLKKSSILTVYSSRNA